MKFALATTDQSPQSLAARATEFGFDGVDLRNVPPDPPGAAQALAPTNVAVACIASGVVTPTARRDRANQAARLRAAIDAAATLGAPFVTLAGTPIQAGRSASAAAVAMTDWLTPLADYAITQNVTLLVENTGAYRTARPMWMLLEAIHHPGVAACWDPFQAAAAGESPAVSVPTLNSRIQHARIQDAGLHPTSSTNGAPGSRESLVRDFLTRLRGIGYRGFATLDLPQDLLPHSIPQLRTWTTPPPEKPTPGKKSLLTK